MHYAVMILGEDPEGQLLKYDERLEVPKYIRYTKQKLIAIGKQRIENFKINCYDKYLENKKEYISKSSKDHINYIQKEFSKQLKWTDEEIYNYEIENSDEEDIGEDGEVYSTCNPLSKWDWYERGGRFAGLLKLKKNKKQIEPINFSYGWSESNKEYILSENRTDIAYKKDIENLNEIKVYAFIKDGEWYEKEKYNFNDKETSIKINKEWEFKFRKILNDLPNDTLISIYDCHI